MKATPIAEFLARTAAQSPRAEPASNPLHARRIASVNDDSEPEFHRSGLAAALTPRAGAPKGLVRPLDPSAFAPRREPAASRPPAPPPAPEEDWDARLSEAYHRGVQEGLDAGKAEAATARALERADLQKRAVVEKLDFQMNEFARLSEALTQGFGELERRIAEAAARLLQPLVNAHLAREIVAELAENIARLTRSGSGGVGLLKVRGPQRLLSALQAKIATLAVDVNYVEDEGVEILVTAQSTEIRSELVAWTRLIEAAVENGSPHG